MLSLKKANSVEQSKQTKKNKKQFVANFLSVFPKIVKSHKTVVELLYWTKYKNTNKTKTLKSTILRQFWKITHVFHYMVKVSTNCKYAQNTIST